MSPVKTARISGEYHYGFLSPDGTKLGLAKVNRDKTSLWFHEADGGKTVAHFSTKAKPKRDAPFAVDFSSYGHFFTLGDRDGNIELWDAREGKHLCRERVYEGSVQDLSITPNVDAICTVGSRRGSPPTVVKLFDTQKWKSSWKYGIDKEYEIHSNQMKGNRKMTHILVSKQHGHHEIRCLDFRKPEPAFTLDLAKDKRRNFFSQTFSFMRDCTIHSFDVSRNGRIIVTTNAKELSVWDVPNQRTIGSISLPEHLEGKNLRVSITPDGKRAMYGNCMFDISKPREPEIIMEFRKCRKSLSSHISADGQYASMVTPDVVRVYKYDGSGACGVDRQRDYGPKKPALNITSDLFRNEKVVRFADNV